MLGAGPGSLWIEEREGRIKVLDIKVSGRPPCQILLTEN